MQNMIRVECPVCKVDSDDIRFVVEGLRVVKCGTCGLLYYNPNVSKEIHKKFVNDEDFYVAPKFQELRAAGNYNLQVYLEHLKTAEVKGYPDWLEPEHLRAKVSWGRRIMGWFLDTAKGAPLKSVLEIGGGTGHMLKDFKKFGDFEYVVSQDISDWAYKTGKEMLPDIIFKCGEVYDLEFEQKFDCVLMWDSLEHVQYPDKLLSKLNEITNDNALIIIQTPDAEYAEDLNWRYWSPEQHCFFFTRKTLDLLLSKYNFNRVSEKLSPEQEEMVLIYQKGK